MKSTIKMTTDKSLSSNADTLIARGMREVLGSCSFCNAGTLTSSGNNLSYPYSHVTKITGVGISVIACDSCLELIDVISSALRKDPLKKMSVHKQSDVSDL